MIPADLPNRRTLFPGETEMARRMRDFDWSKTDLGAPEGWPQNLRVAVSLCLTSRIPIVMYWGREFTVLYNDPYISFLGETKHPRFLGQPARECWSEIWHTIAPMLEGVIATTWSEDLLMFFARRLPLEEVYVRFTFGPILAADGRTVDGIFCPCTETTDNVVSARRLDTLRKLGVRPLESQTVEAACEEGTRVIAENPQDIPFAAVYLLDESGVEGHLAMRVNLPDHSDAVPERISLSDSDSTPWPFTRVARTRTPEEVSSLERIGHFSGILWPEPVNSAVVLPLLAAGHDKISGLMIIGVSPRRVLDRAYRDFFDLVAGHIATAIANARAYEEERKRVGALAEIDRAKTVFFSNVSHEFRTPLTLILGPTEEMISGALGEITDLQRAHLSTLRDNAVRLQKLVNTLLDFARVETGRIEAKYEPVDLSLVTRELASTFCSAVHRAGLLFVVNCPSLDEPVYVDRDVWEKIVLNLLSNALKFTFRGVIEVSVRSVDSTVAFAVRDTGVGIPEEELPRLFDRFHRVRGTLGRTQEGSGIGLALVQELVRLHGGRVHVESALGKGTTFTVFIPKGSTHLPKDRLGAPRRLSSTALGAAPFIEEVLRWLPDDDQRQTSPRFIAPSEVTPTAVSLSPGTERIIIADDNMDMRNYLRRLLELHWNVETVENGSKALGAAREQPPPELIIADVMMPGLNGFELLKELRADVRTKTIPVILLSARAGEEAYIEGMNAGADDYIVKPFGARELIARVKALLEVTRVRRESEERFRTMADSSPIMIWMTDAEGHTTFLNRTYLEYFGIAAEEAAAFDWSGIVHPDDRAAYLAAFQTALQTRQTFHQRARLRRFDGEWRWFESRGNPIVDATGKMRGFIGSSPDITEIYESQQALRELDQRKDEFLANMSHEIRSPLTGILGFADILLTRIKDPQNVEYLRTIKESGNYLIEIINDILDLSRIEAGKLVLNIAAISLHSVLAEIQSLMEVRAKQKNLPVVLKYDGGLPPSIQTDRTRLRQILINLVSNAIKFTDRGSVQIVARFLRKAGLIQIEVIDTGIGIAQEHQDRLFQPFTQADSTSTREYGGTGLGLTITKRLVEMLGGSIWFESELNKGSTFRVTIPTARVQSASKGADTRSQIGTALDDMPLYNYHVLIVDDRAEIRYLVSRFITDAGGRPTAVSNGKSAIETIRTAAESDPFHVIILDIQMPGMDGYEVAQKLRAEGFKQPIIALTAGAMVGEREKCLQAGCDDYLTKPIDRQALVRLIAHHTEKAARSPNTAERKLRLLLVDDNVAACTSTCLLLEMSGYEVRTALNGQSALKTARTFLPDVILLDLKLPDTNGYELMERLKQMDGLDRARFIALSGYSEDDVQNVTTVKFDHFLTKPLDANRLETILHSTSV